MRVKEGVRLLPLRPVMYFAYYVAYEVYKELGNKDNCVITSAADGKHKRSSEHYKGDAIDIRVWGFRNIDLEVTPVCDYTGQQAAHRIKARLSDEFEVFFEGDHIHIGFDPQTL